MFIKTTKSKNFTYVQLVESYREDGKTKHRVLLKLGRLDQLKEGGGLSKIAYRLMELAGNPTVKGLKELSRHIYGHTVYRKLWKKLDVGKILETLCKSSKISFPLEEVIFYLSVNRLLCASSKKKAFEMMPSFLDISSKIELHHIYRSLDFLSENKEEIELALFNKQVDLFHMELDVVFYDVTTFHFESQKADELRNFGFSKANKINEVQVVLGLLINREGRPIGYELFEGNTFEGKTMIIALEKLKKRFSIKKVVIVADKGMNSNGNLHLIRQAGYDYIVSSRLKNEKKVIKDQILKREDFLDTVDADTAEVIYSYKDIENSFVYKDEDKKSYNYEDRLMVSWTAPRAASDRKKRQRLWDRAQKMVADGKKKTFNNDKGAARYLKKDGKSQAVDMDQTKFEKDAEWDGFYGVQYSGRKLSHQEVMEQYHRLWKIEECFRVMKTTMHTRPIFHWSPSRIKGHFVLCFIAFLLERTLELKLAKNGVNLSPQKIKEALNSLQVSKVELGGQQFYMKGKNNADASAILSKMRINHLKDVTPIDQLKLD